MTTGSNSDDDNGNPRWERMTQLAVIVVMIGTAIHLEFHKPFLDYFQNRKTSSRTTDDHQPGSQPKPTPPTPSRQYSVAPLTLQQANNLLRAGKYEQLTVALKRDLQSASGSDLIRINNMLKGLERFLPQPSAQSPVSENGTFHLANSASSTLPRGQKPQRILVLGGSKGNWMSAVAYNTPYSSQQVIFQSSFPSALIQQAWKENLRITSVGGDANEWGVVLSRYKDGSVPAQTFWGPGASGEKMEAWIASKQRDGLHITSLAGFDNQWVVVMSGSTGWGRQRFTRPAAPRNDWIAERAKEGFMLTSAAGGYSRLSDGKISESYMFVTTQGTGYTAYTHWPRANREKFLPWFMDQKKNHTPVAFFGNNASNGAALVKGSTYGVNCGHQLNASASQAIDWFNNIGVGAPD